MQHTDFAGEARVDAIQELRCQRDFRDDDQAAPCERARLSDGAEIDFGFATTGDAVEQKSLKAALGNALAYGSKSSFLL